MTLHENSHPPNGDPHENKINAFNEHSSRPTFCYLVHHVNLTNHGNIMKFILQIDNFSEIFAGFIFFWVWLRLILFKFLFILGETWKMDFFNLLIKMEMKKRVPFSFFSKKIGTMNVILEQIKLKNVNREICKYCFVLFSKVEKWNQ